MSHGKAPSVRRNSMQDRLLRCHRVVAALNAHVELDPRASYSIGLSMDSLTDLSDNHDETNWDSQTQQLLPTWTSALLSGGT